MSFLDGGGFNKNLAMGVAGMYQERPKTAKCQKEVENKKVEFGHLDSKLAIFGHREMYEEQNFFYLWTDLEEKNFQLLTTKLSTTLMK